MISRVFSLAACAAVSIAVGLIAAPPASAVPWGADPALTAAHLFNLVKFVEWPSSGTPATPIQLCVLNDPASEAALARLVARNPIEGREVAVLRGVNREDLGACNLLYVSSDERDTAADVLAGVKGLPILTVGNGKLFAKRTGIVGLLFDARRITLAINPAAAQRSRLRLSSTLLTLATLVRD